MVKRNNKYPRRLRMNRKSRLQAAKSWLQDYTGKNLIKGYRKHFGVSMVQAAIELRMLGCDVSEERIEQLRINEMDIVLQRKRRKQQRSSEALANELLDCDEDFYFIAGHTPEGVPFGVTWGEMEAFIDKDLSRETDEEIPF